MSTENNAAPKQQIVRGWIGLLLVRLAVPIWIFFGAYSKLEGATPKSLPRSILDAGGVFGFTDHYLLLSILVAIEFIFITTMLFIPKLARLATVVLLGIFLCVLSIEMFVYGNYESCGCFGEKSLAPMIMFAIDFALLLGVVLCKPKQCCSGSSKVAINYSVAIVFALGSTFYTFKTIMASKPQENHATATDTNPLPSSWYPKSIGNWVGENIDDLELFDWVTSWPQDLHVGKQYVVFYSLTCDHCEALMYAYFEFPTIPTTLVAIPQSTAGFNYDGAFENPCFDCNKTELKVGPDWIIGSPLVVALENGVIRCVTENEDYEAPACLIW
mgnify:CR=1 FL=1